MLVKDAVDCVDEQLDGPARARSFRREQDQPGVRLTSSEAFGGERPEVLDVAGDHRPALRSRNFEDQSVGPSSQLLSVADRLDIVAATAQQLADTRR